MTDTSAEYEPGDVNYEAGDINEIGDDLAESDVVDEGNRAAASLSAAVLNHLATAIADEPDAVVVETELRGRRATFRLHVAQPDMGRVIGRRGRTAQAIRALVAAAGAREGISTSVDIVD